MESIAPAITPSSLITKYDEETDQRYGCAPSARPLAVHIKYGIINLDKPAGPSSHEVVAWVRRILKLSHAGHGGTLEVQKPGSSNGDRCTARCPRIGN